MKVLKIVKGYCNNCQRPEDVAEIEVTGWAYHIFECKDCLNKILQQFSTK